MGLKDDGYIVMSAHREENVDIPEKFDRLYPALNQYCGRIQDAGYLFRTSKDTETVR
jgi:UDP-N-acetylglucosamine 2-epimerase